MNDVERSQASDWIWCTVTWYIELFQNLWAAMVAALKRTVGTLSGRRAVDWECDTRVEVVRRLVEVEVEVEVAPLLPAPPSPAQQRQ